MFVLHPSWPVFHSSLGELTWRSSRFAGIWWGWGFFGDVLLSLSSCFKSSSALVSALWHMAEKCIAVVRNTTLAVILHGHPLILEPSGGFVLQSIYFSFLLFLQQLLMIIKFLSKSKLLMCGFFLWKLPEFACVAVTVYLNANLLPNCSWQRFASKVRRNWKISRWIWKLQALTPISQLSHRLDLIDLRLCKINVVWLSLKNKTIKNLLYWGAKSSKSLARAGKQKNSFGKIFFRISSQKKENLKAFRNFPEFYTKIRGVL